MYDDRLYLSCCRCFKIIRRDEAVRMPELHGGFCSEACALRCLQENNLFRYRDWQIQAGDHDTQIPVPLGAEEPELGHFDDLSQRTTRGSQHE